MYIVYIVYKSICYSVRLHSVPGVHSVQSEPSVHSVQSEHSISSVSGGFWLMTIW